MTIGQRLNQARIRAGFTDEKQFAERLGVSVAMLTAWEADIEAPSDEQLRRFAALAGIDAETLPHLVSAPAPSGICRPVDLVPDSSQAEILEQVGLPRELWGDSDRWVAFLRLTRAAAELSAEEISRLADRAETCLIDES
ncbi:MAG: helix-turn-helix domain-containing protein [Armatimonadota bacterium]|jgi:transcriptional regulator with XRE-family HTH domain